MVDIDELKGKGVTPEKLKALFTSDTKSAELERLINRVRARIHDGIRNNFSTYKIYHAIDQAFDAPLRQITPTLIQSLAGRPVNDDNVYKAWQDFGLTHLISETGKIDPKTGKPLKALHLPTFFEVVIPIVRGLLLMRWGKLVNDRNLTPGLKYEALKSTPLNRARCELLTDRVQTIWTQYGLFDVRKQAILKALLYGAQIKFIQEAWHSEEQWVRVDGKSVKKCVKEGHRYHLPHPTRTYVDQAHPASTINSDSGVEFVGYWRIRKFGDVERMDVWNKDKITIGKTDWRKDNPTFFNAVYGSCILSFPDSSVDTKNNNDKETAQATRFYTSDKADTAVMVTEHFEKLIPKENGLGDYDCPVWFRFLVGGDDTILYAEALPDCPAVYYGCDVDESRSVNPSLALDALPYQDIVSNLLTQTLLSVKQNLANLTFVDEDIVSEKTFQDIENTGEGRYRKLNLARYSGRKLRAAQGDVTKAVTTVRFSQLDTTGTLNAIQAVLSLAERCLGMSSQEVAAAASHEQTAEEVRNIAQSTSTRLTFTGTGIDRATDAWKRQLHSFLMAFGEPEFYAQLSAEARITEKDLAALGFTVEDHARSMGDKMLVKGKKTALAVEFFASTRDGNDRVNNTALAAAMVQMLGNALNNQMLSGAIGPEQAIQLLNKAIDVMGLPRDFQLVAMPNQQQAGPEVITQIQQQIVEMAEGLKAFVAESVAAGGKAVMDEVTKGIEPLAVAVRQLSDDTDKNTLSIDRITEVLKLMENNDYTDTTAVGPGTIEANSAMAGAAGMPSV